MGLKFGLNQNCKKFHTQNGLGRNLRERRQYGNLGAHLSSVKLQSNSIHTIRGQEHDILNFFLPTQQHSKVKQTVILGPSIQTSFAGYTVDFTCLHSLFNLKLSAEIVVNKRCCLISQKVWLMLEQLNAFEFFSL